MQFELREWMDEDIDSLVENADNGKIACNLRDAFPHPYTRESGAYFLNMCSKMDKAKNMICAIVIEGKAVGSIGLFVKEDVSCKSAEIGYWLAEKYWGKGIMTQAVQRICEKGFQTFDIVRIYAEIYDYNTASQRVLEKNGFQYEGTLRKSVYKNHELHDSVVYALIQE